jgi:hypothetical protein
MTIFVNKLSINGSTYSPFVPAPLTEYQIKLLPLLDNYGIRLENKFKSHDRFQYDFYRCVAGPGVGNSIHID